jgi:membrane associated rhomboid family serine protease
LSTVSLSPPGDWKRARVTLGLIAVTTLVWIVLSMLRQNEWAAVWGGFVPARVAHLTNDDGLMLLWLTPLTAAFLHANILHLAANMVFLAFCGRATEAVLGPIGLIVLYLLGAYAAAAVQYLFDPSAMVPMIGASGAISAVLGAYAVLFGRNKVKVRSPKLALALHVLWLMAAWIVLNLIVFFTFARWIGVLVAVGAHIGGFMVGVVLAFPLLMFRYRKA